MLEEQGAATLTKTDTGDTSGDGNLLEGADGADQPGLGQEAVSGEGKEQQGESQDEPTFEDLQENWQDHPDIKAHVEEARESAAAETQGDKDRELRQVRADHVTALEKAQETAIGGSVVKEVASGIKAIIDKAQELTTVEEAETLLNNVLDDPRHTKYTTAYNADIEATHETKGVEKGFQRARAFLSQGLPAELAKKMEAADADLSTAVTLKEVGTWGQAFEKLLSERDGFIRADERSKVGAMKGAREGAEDRALKRESNPSAPDTSGRGGKGHLTRARVEEMSAEDISKIPLEELQDALK